MASVAARSSTHRKNQRRLARVRHKRVLAHLKRAILYGNKMSWGEQDATQLVNSVLLLGTDVLGFHCEPGYHDELVAWHLGIVQDIDGLKLTREQARSMPWERKVWKWREQERGGERLTTAVLAPRGTGKTIWASVLAIWYAIRHRNVRILITSKTDRAALRLSDAMRAMLTVNPIIRQLFGDLRGNPWDKHGFNIAGRSRVAGADTFTVIGTGGQIASVHFEVIMADDIATAENSRTKNAREKLVDWYFTSLEPTCRPTADVPELGFGRIHGSGTRYNARDLHFSLQHESKDYREGYRRFPSMRPSPRWRKAHAPELRRWAADTRAAIARGEHEDRLPKMPKPQGAEALDPKTWVALCGRFLSVKQLLYMRANMPRSAFESQYQVDADALEGKLVKADWIRWVPEERSMEKLLGAAGMDMAIKTAQKHDYTALIHVKLDAKFTHTSTGQRGRVLVWDATVERLTLAQKVALVKSEHRLNHPSVIRVETNAAQALFIEQPEFGNVPIEGKAKQADKLTAASHLLTWFEQGRIAFVERTGPHAERIAKGMQETIYQLLDFTGDDAAGVHDDAVDALGFAVDAVTSRWTKPVDQSKDPPQEEGRIQRAGRHRRPGRRRRVN